jgi:hypothetical protein
VVVQFVILFYNPINQIPTERERQAAQAIVQRVRDLPGEVLVYYHGLVSFQAGKENYYHIAPFGDVQASNLRADSKNAWRKKAVLQMVSQTISRQVFDWIVIDQPEANWLPYYLYSGQVVDDNGAMYPVTKNSMIPRSLMVKNPVAHGGFLPLGDENLNRYFVEGWGKAKNGERMASGSISTVQLAVEKKHDYEIKIDVEPVCEDGQPVINTMGINWNGDELGEMKIQTCETLSISLDLAKDQVKKEFNQLQFKWDEFSLVQNTPLTEPQAVFHEIMFVQK